MIVPPVVDDRTIVISNEEIKRAAERAEAIRVAQLLVETHDRLIAEAQAKKIADAKKAKQEAAAKLAAERKAKVQAVLTKIATTKARGEALKQKSSWINLMKYFYKSATIK